MARDRADEAGGEGPAGQICPACTANNLLTARSCEVCGEVLAGREEDDDPGPPPLSEEEEAAEAALSYVPAEERESLGTFGTQIEVDLAAGYLRSFGIAAEVGNWIYEPGMGSALWVRRAEAGEARRLLAERAALADTEDAPEL